MFSFSRPEEHMLEFIGIDTIAIGIVFSMAGAFIEEKITEMFRSSTVRPSNFRIIHRTICINCVQKK